MARKLPRPQSTFQKLALAFLGIGVLPLICVCLIFMRSYESVANRTIESNIHAHLCIFERILFGEEVRQFFEIPPVNVMTGYRTFLLDGNDIADGQAMPTKIIRFIMVEAEE